MQTKLRSEIKKLNDAQKLKLIGEIWDSIADDSPALELTPAQKRELERRMAYYKDHPDELIPWEEIEAELDRQIQMTRGAR